MTITEFITKAEQIRQSNTVYMYGTVGQTVTENLINAKAMQYPKWYTAKRMANLKKKIGYIGYDCSGLIKSILKEEGFPDINADTIFKNYCTKVDNPSAGCLAHKSGHIAICVDADHVIEAASGSGKVVLADIAGRNFKEFGKFNFLKEETQSIPTPSNKEQIIADLKKIIEKYEGRYK